jgi:hypothetical protein
MLPIETIKQNAQDFAPGILKKEDYEKFKNLIGKTVINLSDFPISKNQELVLEKGLTFCPSPGRPDYSEIWLDFKEFHRKLELKKFTPKSNWRPPIPNKTLEAFYRAVKNDLIQDNMRCKKLEKDNLSKQDREFIKQLKSNNNIIIKKADKGSAVVRLSQRRLQTTQ